MKIYLAGPMRGYEQWNFPAFKEARERLRGLGHTVFCPAATNVALGYTPENGGESDRSVLEHVIQMDIACIFAADAIALLPGWEKSRGATVELALAHFLGLEVYDAEHMQQINLLKTPWELHHHMISRPRGSFIGR